MGHYPINLIVAHIMLVVVGFEINRQTHTLALVIEDERRLLEVDVVIRPNNHEIRMTNPQPMVSNGFKDQRRMLAFELGLELAFPSGPIVFPLQIHANYVAQYSRKTMHTPVQIKQILTVKRGRLGD